MSVMLGGDVERVWYVDRLPARRRVDRRLGPTKGYRWEQLRSDRGLSEGGVVVWLGGGDWLLSVAVEGKTLRLSFVYDIAVGVHHIHGRRVSDEQIQAWADEAEAGYDLRQLPRPTPGRPPVGRGLGTVVTVRSTRSFLRR